MDRYGGGRGGPALAFRPAGQGDLAPPGRAAKLAANLAALEVLDRLRSEDRPASAGDQAVLARWSGWGALPQIFDEDDDTHATAREQARRLLGSDGGWVAARRTTLNAHYTPAEVVGAIWRAVEGLGFAGGRVLEPGCGSGTFLGLAPEGCELEGVEADPATAAVARHLYGARATIVAQRLEEFSAPEGSFDLVIGNVPFAKVTPHDPRHNRARLALHNYAIVKGLDLTRPGGLAAVLTSRYTADARNPAARREIDSRADLVGALRFPAGAFAAAAGTEVVADLLVLRRRGEGEEHRGLRWATTVPLDCDEDDGGEAVFVNELFAARPDLVLGRLGVDRGMYRERELTVAPVGELLPALDRALDAIVADGRRSGLTAVPRPPADREPVPANPAPSCAQESSFVVTEGRLGRVVHGRVAPYTPRYGADEAELRRLVHLRDQARTVLAAQVAGAPDAELVVAQDGLCRAYDTYARAHGPLNRFRTARTGRVDPETGEEVMRRMQPRMGGFRDDPDWPLVAALEVFDDATQTARPAAIFTERVVSPPPLRLGVDTAAEAVAVCMDEAGRLDLDRIAELLGTDAATARAELAGLAFDDPDTAALVPASAYLSGNVRTKLAAARSAAVTDGRFQVNVAALEEVLPRQLEPGEITAGLGAPWVPAGDVQAFCADVLGAEVEVERLAALGHWAVRLVNGRRGSVSLSSEWGTARADAIALLDAGLNQRLHTVYDEDGDGKRVRNDAETLAARDKQEALATRFSSWVWEEPDRAARLAGRYNELFRSNVVPRHDGSHLSLPGLAATFTPHPHQRDAVARILTDGRVLLAHAVGAGKTATIVMAAMEMRRLGMAAKPAVVVPNHMLAQFSREWLQLYPTAKLLIADRDRLSKQRRKEFVARCATGDWDGVVFTPRRLRPHPPRGGPVRRLPGREPGGLPAGPGRVPLGQGHQRQAPGAPAGADGGDLPPPAGCRDQGRRRELLRGWNRPPGDRRGTLL
ncbi:MAG: methyltransferase domain-containing protein [Acidimicrobiales bacterium]